MVVRETRPSGEEPNLVLTWSLLNVGTLRSTCMCQAFPTRSLGARVKLIRVKKGYRAGGVVLPTRFELALPS